MTAPDAAAPASRAQTAAGSPSDAVSALEQGLLDAAKHASGAPAPDGRVSAAFALGWQMAEVYRPNARSTVPPAGSTDLPGLARLGDDERALIAVKQIEVGLVRLASAVTAAGLTAPDFAPLQASFAHGVTPSQRSQAVLDFHLQLLSTLTASDYRLGTAYGLGRALADTCRNPVDRGSLAAEFKPHRISQLRAWLDDLTSALPPHAGHSVGDSLGRWAQWTAGPGSNDPLPDGTLNQLRRQGDLWRSLLAAEKSGPDMLEPGNYLDAASQLLRTSGGIVLRFAARFWWVVLVALGLFGVGLSLLISQKATGTIVAGAGALLASFGVTWKGIGGSLGAIGGKVELQLWGAELDTAIADAITLLPSPLTTPRKLHHPPQRGQHRRRQLALQASPVQPAVQVAPAVAAPLLHGVLDPDQLLAKINGRDGKGGLHDARTAAMDDLNELPADRRLPEDYFHTLSESITEEARDPARVTRAATPPGPDGPPAPPAVIYLSRKPSVSQFMSVITHCVEAELAPNVVAGHLEQLAHLDHLLRGAEHWIDDLRSRFRTFGPCDIRFLEPVLASLLTRLGDGKHPFATTPPDCPLAENAKVFVVGDWATGLPQARNVAARIHEQLASVTPGVECHVIHLGDTYYSGLEDECRRRFLDLWPVDFGSTVSSWTLAGNHDMYAGGYGYYDVLLADPRFAKQNRCSFFRLANAHWQILGLDSSYTDPDQPDLQAPQPLWLSEHTADPSRGTVLLSHHQPFSPYENVESALPGTVSSALGGRPVEAWLWGHEHRCAVYEPDIVWRHYDQNARYTAVVGHGGVPNLLSGAPAPQRQAVAWEFADSYQIGDDRWGLGGFAVLTFAGPTLEIQYYDEYGTARRSGAPVNYPGEAAGIRQVQSAGDARPVFPADVLEAGTAGR
jgi:hypothetical protein